MTQINYSQIIPLAYAAKPTADEWRAMYACNRESNIQQTGVKPEATLDTMLELFPMKKY